MKRIARFALLGAVGFGIGGLFSGPISLFGFAIVVLNPGWNPGWLWAVIGFAIWGFGFAVKGAIGGTALGLALRKGRRLTATLALFGAIGFLVGGYLFLLFYMVPVLSRPGGMFPADPWGIVLWALGGAIGGTALGLALRKGGRIIAALTLFGAIGFLVVGSLFAVLVSWGMLPTVFSGIGLLDGALGGAALGLAFMDRRKIIGLALAGALGFGIGWVIANYLQHWIELGGPLLVFITVSLQGIIGGAALGAVMGYLEKQKTMQNTPDLIING